MTDDTSGTPRHPARYSEALFPVFALMLKDISGPKGINVLDPMAGTGRIHELRNVGPYRTYGIELEPEWALMHPDTRLGDALALEFADDLFDAIVTSPTYGNRYADSHKANDGSERRSYTHDLGRKLHPHNSGAMQWGDDYRAFHEAAWTEARRVLRPGGRFILNVKDHIRGGKRQYVAGWHVTTLCKLGFDLLQHVDVETPGMRRGANSGARVGYESVYVFELSNGKGR